MLPNKDLTLATFDTSKSCEVMGSRKKRSRPIREIFHLETHYVVLSLSGQLAWSTGSWAASRWIEEP